jgi:hypothetical protein
MTQEQKELLLKDLCARLPYGVKCEVYNCIGVLDEVTTLYGVGVTYSNGQDTTCRIDECKPYLFPLSSMTDEMLEELNANGFFKYRDTIANVSHLESKNGINEEIYTYIDIECISFLIEYFHSHHIDYKGFIEKNLAIDATGLNIY